jgi:uncharacterized membrane protein YebE (DUF533 family)
MLDPKRLLDALVGAAAGNKPAQGRPTFLDQALEAFGQRAGPTGGLSGSGLEERATQLLRQAGEGVREGAERTGLGGQVDRSARELTGRSADDLARTAKDFVSSNPGLAQAGALGLAGLLLGTRSGRTLASNLVGVGGLALIGGLAYKAFQNVRGGRPMLAGGEASAEGGALPAPGAFDPAGATDEDALLLVRAMVAAAASDGHIDDAERARITSGLAQAGIDAEATRWLERELSAPATPEELAAPVTTPEKGAQVYAAARVAIEPDTMQEREFLRRLAQELDLSPEVVRNIDDAAAAVKVG